ncbi:MULTISPECIES: FmdB family zinc ribbon protein [Cryobacterium]|uniref:FmdB family transcriptional regulator n=1 Tax=Cryobacterium zongtaii TaxID=1259217 RepID=A0A2S3ZMY8_9MICO|nr:MULTISPECIES: FmdB family zinc ribbon protein [Cryobacterium]POH68692.1 FmdB family transcriptional regulator [Cryobacterium zongtaii]POH70312.1 FmdB family transcriptional regulator [Cryobacterium zongtaii]TFC49394.1 FmdB family transcriptional regulator [Cryobacterium sp. TMN-39-2]
MPTYSYRCTECDTAFDIQQAFTDNTLTECPACGGKLRKVYSSIGVSFSGSGFYRNDSRAESGGKSSLSAEKGAKKTDSSSESSSAKPAEKSSTPAASTSGSSSSGSGSSSGSTTTAAPKAS